jgi:protein transport protein SEC23
MQPQGYQQQQQSYPQQPHGYPQQQGQSFNQQQQGQSFHGQSFNQQQQGQSFNQQAPPGFPPQPAPQAFSPQQAPQAAAPQVEVPVPVPGLRWTFTAYPNTGKPKASDASQWGPPTPEMVIPLAAMYTPLCDPADSDHAPVPVVSINTAAELPLCKNCGVHWNTFCRSDFASAYWMCPACLSRNQLPQGASQEHPAVSNATVEYSIAAELQVDLGPLFVYVVDVSLPENELEPLKENLLRSLEWLPPNAHVSVISFGHNVTLWEPGFAELNKCYAFRGNRSYTKTELLACLGVANQGTQGVGKGPVSGRFFVPLAESEFTLTSVIDELQVDPFTPRPKERALRATGPALELAVSLVELVGGPSRGGRIMLFTGGPSTRGPGAIVTVDKGEMIRAHRDLLDGNAPCFAPAVEFYQGLEARMSECRVALDTMIMSLDQIGLLEMRPCVDCTGGTMICGDSFGTPMFTESFKRVLHRLRLRDADAVPGCGFDVHLRLHMSADTKICGAIGPCRARFGANAATTAKAQGDARFVSSTKVGVADTSQWIASAVDTSSTFTFVFDTEAEGVAPGTVVEPGVGQRRFVQFVTTYRLATGDKRVRITSAFMPVARTKEAALYAQPGVFDQACAAAVTSRLAIDTMEKHDNRPLDLTRRWIDRVLVRFVKKFGTYSVGDPNSLRLASVFSLFPVFLFNLRRSEYFMLLNISPDETTFKRHYLRRESCDNCLLMIQPAVTSYDMTSPVPRAVPLDSESIQRENVLLMDAFFNVAVLRGSTVEEWRRAGYQSQPEYAAFKSLLERPEADAEAILTTRIPYPRYTNCDQHGSQARHVLTRLNPSVSHHSGVADSRSFSAAHQGVVKEVIYTDDASIARFMAPLKAAAVAPES